MPRVKIDYVVSFSSEDPENRAETLLAGEVSKKKWLCKKGESSCSVVLQLPRAVEISAVHIGAYHAALVEVLVGLSERPNDPFQVLVPSSVFVPPAQSRRDEGVSRVRSFTGEELAADTRGKRYDRVRVVCSQPYNKHCQYGLSFVHIHEPESRNDPPPLVATAPAVPSRMFALDTFSSDEEDFRPGDLFAKHYKSPTIDNPGNSNTGAQIRQATSQALKNIPDASTKLLKTPITKAGNSRQKQTEEEPANRQRDSIMYTDDDARPHDKIDRVVNRHKDEKTKDDLNKTKAMDKEKNKDKDNGKKEVIKENKDSDSKNKKNKNDANVSKTDKNQHLDKQRNITDNRENRKRKRDDDGSEQGARCRDQSEVLRGVTLVLSGYAGATRAELRDKAIALGARYSPDWNSRCNHLICAFPNTPKLREARASDPSVAVVTAEWLQRCAAERRRLPWRWYATIPGERTQPTPGDTKGKPVSSGEDSDEETADVLDTSHHGVSRCSTPSPSAATTAEDAALPDSDVSFVKDERFVGSVMELDSDSDGDDTDTYTYDDMIEERIDPKKALPDFFEGYTFLITDEVAKNCDQDIIARYVRGFGGLLIKESEVDEDTKVDYMVCSEGNTWGEPKYKGVRVRPSWVAKCGRERRLCPLEAREDSGECTD